MARFIKLRRRPLLNLPPGVIAAVVLLLVAGIAVGALVVRVIDGSHRQELATYLEGFIYGLGDATLFPESTYIWQLSAWQNLRLAVLLWFFGLTVVGSPLIAAVVFARGFLIGFTVGFFVQELGYRGVLLSAAGVLPHQLVGIPLLIYFASYAVSFSLTWHQTRPRGELSWRMVLYCVVCLLLTAGLLLMSLVEAHASPRLMHLVARWLIPA